MLGRKVFLELFVKVQKDWRENPEFLNAIDWRSMRGGELDSGEGPVSLMRLLYPLHCCLALVLTPLFADKDKDKTPVTDDVIVDQVRVRIADDSEVGGQPIQVDAHNGVVVLTGKITNDKLKSRVEKLAKKVKGVTGVDDKLVVSPE